MIFLRYFFRLPTIWQTDFVVYSATAAIFFGAPYVLMKRAHVSVDVVESLLTGKALEWLQFTGKILGLIFCARDHVRGKRQICLGSLEPGMEIQQHLAGSDLNSRHPHAQWFRPRLPAICRRISSSEG